jgi:tRNA(Arg) A34 adenosine deaminase TadA
VCACACVCVRVREVAFATTHRLHAEIDVCRVRRLKLESFLKFFAVDDTSSDMLCRHYRTRVALLQYSGRKITASFVGC